MNHFSQNRVRRSGGWEAVAPSFYPVTLETCVVKSCTEKPYKDYGLCEEHWMSAPDWLKKQIKERA